MLLLLAAIIGVVAAQGTTTVLDSATYKTCVIDSSLLADPIELGNITCSRDEVGVTALTWVAPSGGGGGVTAQINMQSSVERSAAEKIAVGANRLVNEAALVSVNVSAARGRFLLDKITVPIPHDYHPSTRECGTGTCRLRGYETTDGRDWVLFCPSLRFSLTSTGTVSNGIVGHIGRISPLLHNDLWPPNLGCRYRPLDAPADPTFIGCNGCNGGWNNANRWYFAFINGTVAESGLSPNAVPPEITDDADQWILDENANKICCCMAKNRPHPLPTDSLHEYFPPGGRYRNLYYVQGVVPSGFRTPANMTRVSDCVRYKWPFCGSQSQVDRDAGMPCRAWRFNVERGGHFVGGDCFGGACQSTFELDNFKPLNTISRQYTSTFGGPGGGGTLQSEQAGLGGQSGGTLAPMCSAKMIGDNSATARVFAWPHNYANTPRISPLVNINTDPNMDVGPLAAEGRIFDAYGGPGTCTKAKCSICLSKLGPLNDMNCDNEYSLHMRFPMATRWRINERILTEADLTVTVTTNATTRVFHVGRVESLVSTETRFVLSTQYFDNETQSLFRVNLLKVNTWGRTPSQKGEIWAIDDHWRPGGVISLDEALDYAIGAMRTDNKYPSKLTFAALSATFEPRSQNPQGSDVVRVYGILPHSGFNRYLCCGEPAEYATHKLAMLRSIYPEIDTVAGVLGSTVAKLSSVTMFRSIARPGARSRGNQGRGLFDVASAQAPNPVPRGAPPSDGWVWVDPPRDSVTAGPFCNAMGMTNEWLQAGENIGKYCRSGQIGVCTPGFDPGQQAGIGYDPLTNDVTPNFSVMIARRLAEYTRQCESAAGCYSEPLPFYPPNLQLNDGAARAYTCGGSLCFDSPSEFGLELIFQTVFSGDLMRVIIDLPAANFVTDDSPEALCNVTTGGAGTSSVRVINLGAVPGEFSVVLDCSGAPSIQIETANPLTRTVSPGETVLYTWVLSAAGAIAPRVEDCFFTLIDPVGGRLAMQIEECEIRPTNETAGFDPDAASALLPPPVDFGDTVPPWAIGLFIVAAAVIGLAIIYCGYREIRKAQRWVAKKKYTQAATRSRNAAYDSLLTSSLKG